MDKASDDRVGNYFTEPKKNLEFFSSGCSLLDCVLGGGWALRRISNIIGNKSTGKSLLAIEACANFARKFPNGTIDFREAEDALDESYAEFQGMPLNRVNFGDNDLFTVEDLFEDLDKTLNAREKNTPGLYIVDSLDALSDRDELEREIDKGSYGAAKAKRLSEMFRRLNKRCSDSNMHIMFISQIRDKIGVTFGKKTTRSGGRALDFYASSIIELDQIETLYQTKKKIKRAVGVKILAKCTKNKISLPFRSCEFSIIFGFGIDDLEASLSWLEDIGSLETSLGHTKKSDVIKHLESLEDAAFGFELARINDKIRILWNEVETQFLPTRRKYI